MLILHGIEEMNYTVYIGSSGNKFIFNIAPSNEPKPAGGYPNLGYICRVKGIREKDVKNIVMKAEAIMGRTVWENVQIAEKQMKK